MNAEFGLSGSFESIISSKFIVHNTYTGKRRNFHPKQTPMHGPVNKYELNVSYSRSHFSWLTQAVSKGLISHLYHKAIYE